MNTETAKQFRVDRLPVEVKIPAQALSMFPDFAPEYCAECGEELEKKEIEGRKRLYCGWCGKVSWLNPKPFAGVLVEKDQEILMIERGIEPRKGTWSIPAGFIEWDERPEEAASRELEEETSLEFDPGELELHRTTFLQHPNERYLLGIIYRAEYGEQNDPKAGSDAREVEFLGREQIEEREISFSETETMIQERLEQFNR